MEIFAFGFWKTSDKFDIEWRLIEAVDGRSRSASKKVATKSLLYFFLFALISQMGKLMCFFLWFTRLLT